MLKILKRKPYPHIRLFKSDLLEAFSYTRLIVPALVYLPLIFGLLYFSPASKVVNFISFLLGLLLWSGMEYLIHRFIFHWRARSGLMHRLTFLMHGVHHKDPNDPYRIVTPPAMSLLIAALFVPICWILLPVEAFYGVVAGSFLGYLCYDYLHFALHHFHWRNRVFQYLKRKHFYHHFKNPRQQFSVTTPIWDIIFKTYQK